MKLRTDLLSVLRLDDVIASVEIHNHRYKPGPLFAKTGTGSLSPASTGERASEVKRVEELIWTLRKRTNERV